VIQRNILHNIDAFIPSETDHCVPALRHPRARHWRQCSRRDRDASTMTDQACRSCSSSSSLSSPSRRSTSDASTTRGARRRSVPVRHGVTPLIGALALFALYATPAVDAKAKLQIVNSANDIVHASHILCGSGAAGKEKCLDYEEMLAPYTDAAHHLEQAFAELAVKYSECPTGSEGGDLGYFPRGEMAKDFERVVFDAKTPLDAVVGPVETRNGWHLVLVHDRHLADDEAKEKARSKQEALKQERLERAEQQRAYQEHREQRRRERSMRANLKDRETDKHSLHHDEL
jgi:hypothetical protein